LLLKFILVLYRGLFTISAWIFQKIYRIVLPKALKLNANTATAVSPNNHQLIIK